MENIWNVNVFCCLLEQSNARQFIWLQNSRIMWHKLETAAEYYEQWPPALMEQPAECRWHYLELFGVIIHYTFLAVQNSSIGDLVSDSITDSVTFDFDITE